MIPVNIPSSLVFYFLSHNAVIGVKEVASIPTRLANKLIISCDDRAPYSDPLFSVGEGYSGAVT